MISDISVNHYYQSPTGLPFRVKEIARHGQDCSQAMIVYENVVPTKDYPAFETWVIAESVFLSKFSEFSEGTYYARNNALRASEQQRLATREAFHVAFSDEPDSTAV